MTTRPFLSAIGVFFLLATVMFLPAATRAEAVAAVPSVGPPVYYDYRNYTEISTALLALESQNPAICKVHDIGDSWEKVQGIAMRDILALKISDNVLIEEDEPEVLVVGLHHAREWTTSEIVYELAENLTSGYGSDPRISWLVDNREIWLVPIVNPDGLDYALTTDEWWRKNRRLNYDHSYGVDLNRNYAGSMNGDPAGEWGGEGSSHDPTSEVYCGLTPFSEPETLAVKALVEAHNFSIALDFHSYSELVLWPWGYTTDTPPDNEHLVRIGHELAALNGYTPEQSVGLYPTTGDSIDWFYGGFGIFAFCIEVGLEFHPDLTDEVQGIIDENLPVSLLGIEISGDKYESDFTIDHLPVSTREYSPSGFGINATITAQRGVDAASAAVWYSVDGGSFQELPMSSAGSNDSYAATVPVVPVGSVVEYYIYAEDLGGSSLSSPRYAPYELHSFRVSPPPSDLPPVIQHSPRNATLTNDTAFVEDGISISAAVTDDVELTSVRLHFRAEGSSGPFVGLDMATIGGAEFSASIPAGYDACAEYYIEANDSIGQAVRDPADAPSQVYLSYNLPPMIDGVLLPGSPPGNVSINGTYPVLVDITDDYGVSAVVLSYSGSSVGVGSLPMDLVAGTNTSGTWSVDIYVGSAPGTIMLNLSADDDRALAWANGSVIVSVDSTPPVLVHEPMPTIPSDLPVVAVRAYDNVAVAQVWLHYALGEGPPFETAEMVLSSGDAKDGIYEAELSTGGYVGDLLYFFEASDGARSSLLPDGAPSACFTSSLVDQTPLQVFFFPPSQIDGSEGTVVVATVENADPGTSFTLKIMDEEAGEATNLSMAEIDFGVVACELAPGLPLGQYTLLMVAEKDSEVLWNSTDHPLAVVDLTPPECELLPVDLESANDSREVEIRVVASDMYGVDRVTLAYYLGSGEMLVANLSLVDGSASNGTWEAVVDVGGIVDMRLRAEVSDGSQSAFLPSETTWAVLSFSPVDLPSEDEGLWWPGVALLVIVFAAATAAALYLSRARRP